MSIAKTKSELVGTHYIEIAAGKHEGKHWAADSIYIDVQDFDFSWQLFDAFRHSIDDDFDIYESYEISGEAGRRLCDNLCDNFPGLAQKIEEMLDKNEEISFIGV